MQNTPKFGQNSIPSQAQHLGIPRIAPPKNSVPQGFRESRPKESKSRLQKSSQHQRILQAKKIEVCIPMGDGRQCDVNRGVLCWVGGRDPINLAEPFEVFGLQDTSGCYGFWLTEAVPPHVQQSLHAHHPSPAPLNQRTLLPWFPCVFVQKKCHTVRCCVALQAV